MNKPKTEVQVPAEPDKQHILKKEKNQIQETKAVPSSEQR